MKAILPVLGFAALALSACVAAPVAPAPGIPPLASAAPAVKPTALPAPSPVPVVLAETPAPAATPVTGTASWYKTGRRLHRTSSGALLNNNALTAASYVYPMGTKLRVGRLQGGVSVVVLVNDRMPHNHRLLDLSELAARELGLMGCGVATVKVTTVQVAALR